MDSDQLVVRIAAVTASPQVVADKAGHATGRKAAKVDMPRPIPSVAVVDLSYHTGALFVGHSSIQRRRAYRAIDKPALLTEVYGCSSYAKPCGHSALPAFCPSVLGTRT